jgi:hypothetical protein
MKPRWVFTVAASAAPFRVRDTLHGFAASDRWRSVAQIATVSRTWLGDHPDDDGSIGPDYFKELAYARAAAKIVRC